MTSAQFQTRQRLAGARFRRSRLRALLLLLATFLTACWLTACTTKETLTPPHSLRSPYDRSVLWAVAPFTNESGVSTVDGARVADLFAEQTEQVNGIDAVPVNRVIMAMRRLGMQSVSTAAEARTLMNMLGVDGLIVGTVTSYDPYPPPKIGAAIQLFSGPRPGVVSNLDPVEVTRSRTEVVAMSQMNNTQTAGQASGVFDSQDQQVLLWLDDYAAGRTEPASAYGNRIYLVNMELYTQFVAYRLLHDLLRSEQPVQTAEATPEEPDPARAPR